MISHGSHNDIIGQWLKLKIFQNVSTSFKEWCKYVQEKGCLSRPKNGIKSLGFAPYVDSLKHGFPANMP